MIQRFVCGLLLTVVTATAAQAQFQDLACKIPSDANSVVVINVQKIHASPIARQSNSLQQHEKEYAAGLTAIPPSAKRVIAAAQMDLEYLKPIWEVVLAELSDPINTADAVKRANGKLDSVAGLDAFILPSDAYVVKFSDTVAGAMNPGNRQMVARWATQCKAQATPAISPYLSEAIDFANRESSEIVVALDLTHVVHPDRLKLRLQNAEALKGKNVDLDALAKKLATIRGVTLGISIKERRFGAVKVDFAEDISEIEDVAGPLFLEALADFGVWLDDFDSWKGSYAEQTITLQGEMSRPGVRQVLSLIDTSFARLGTAPKDDKSTAAPRVNEEEDEAYVIAKASQQYFQSVSGLLDDFKDRKKNRKTLGQMAVYMDRYADKIDRLPMLNVDEELIGYGQYVSGQLRMGSGAIRGSAQDNRAQQMSRVNAGMTGTYEWGYGSGYYGRYGWGSGSGEWWRAYSLGEQQAVRTQVKIETKNRANSAAQEVMRNIDNATVQVRADMVKKHKMEF